MNAVIERAVEQTMAHIRARHPELTGLSARDGLVEQAVSFMLANPRAEVVDHPYFRHLNLLETALATVRHEARLLERNIQSEGRA